MDEFERIAFVTDSFAMTPPVLTGSSVDVAVTEDFINAASVSQLAYERGCMSITTPAGSTVTSIENWPTWLDALSFQPANLSEQEPLPPANGGGYAIDLDNYREVLAKVFSVYTGTRFGPKILDDRKLGRLATLPDVQL